MPPAANSAPEEDVLELTEMVDPEPEAPRSPPPLPPESKREEDEERILSAVPAAASVAAFSRISELSNRRGVSSGVGLGDGGITLEALVRDELRSLLREWLDDNLPDLVERLVSQEIDRLVRDAMPSGRGRR